MNRAGRTCRWLLRNDSHAFQAGVDRMNIPFHLVIWDAEQCAKYLGEEKSTFLKRTQFKPGFPGRCPKPGAPRWLAVEVTAWATGKENHAQITHEHQFS
jgi:hypothetical protein